MNPTELIERTAAHVRQTLAHDGTGHDWWHVERVWKNARLIAEAEGAELLVTELAALLHDIADWKFHGGDVLAGERAARQWLAENGVAEPVLNAVCAIVAGLSFKGAGVDAAKLSLEGQVVQDADRLDALGAIGIARAFAYGGHAGRALYDPAVAPEMHTTFAAYRDSRAPTINHFYEKLLLLKERMHTATAKKLAEPRHRFLEQYLAQFFEEWNGSATQGRIVSK